MVERLPINFPGREPAGGRGSVPEIAIRDQTRHQVRRVLIHVALRWPLIGTCPELYSSRESQEIAYNGSWK